MSIEIFKKKMFLYFILKSAIMKINLKKDLKINF